MPTDRLAAWAPVRFGLGWLDRACDRRHGTFRGWVRGLLAELEFRSGRLRRFVRPDLRATRRLVFVCLGNINRSPFAHAVALDLGARCTSIGLSTTTGVPAFATAVETARRLGID